jgi:tRNA-dihydrouridine synthase 3
MVDEHVQSRGFSKRVNLRFRLLCKKFSSDITRAEMSLCLSLLNGNPSEWSHLRRHESEDIFGAQITASQPEHAMKIVKV